MSTLSMAKKVISDKINQIKSRIMHKIWPNKRQNAPKRVSNREIKSLENNFSVKATENIINTPRIVAKPNLVTLSKILNQKLLINQKKIEKKNP